METSTKENGKTERRMALEYAATVTERSMKDPGEMGRAMGEGY